MVRKTQVEVALAFDIEHAWEKIPTRAGRTRNSIRFKASLTCWRSAIRPEDVRAVVERQEFSSDGSVASTMISEWVAMTDWALLRAAREPKPIVHLLLKDDVEVRRPVRSSNKHR